jgi:polysaccharide pyruvyl transferase WcaK-like protein
MVPVTVLDGYYGRHNAGDDAFCFVASACAPAVWPGRTLAYLATELPELPRPGVALLAHSARPKGRRRATAILSVLRAGHVVHVGGSTFRRMNRHRRDQQLAARTGRVSLEAVGVSIGPFRNTEDERAIARFLRYFDFISVRDHTSFDRAASLGVPRYRLRAAGDVAILLPTLPAAAPPEEKGPRPRPVLAVSVCRFESLGEGDPEIESVRNARLVSVLRTVAARTGARIRFVVMNSNPTRGDLALTTAMAENVAEVTSVEIVRHSSDVLATYQAIATADCLFGMRLHSLVFAYAAGVPFVSVSYHPKCSDFLDWAGCLPEQDLDARLSDPDAAATALQRATTGGLAAPRRRVAEATRLARSAFPDGLDS